VIAKCLPRSRDNTWIETDDELRGMRINMRSNRNYQNFNECKIDNSLTEQRGHKTFQISGVWADYGPTGSCA
jgi:hypothetical protein